MYEQYSRAETIPGIIWESQLLKMLNFLQSFVKYTVINTVNLFSSLGGGSFVLLDNNVGSANLYTRDTNMELLQN